jgi:hypothetical protein
MDIIHDYGRISNMCLSRGKGGAVGACSDAGLMHQPFSATNFKHFVQLDLIGLDLGYLPSKPPFSLVQGPQTYGPGKEPQTITNATLSKVLGSAEPFYSHYIEVTNRSIDSYAKGKRRKFALRMHGSLAALDV